MTNDLSYLIYGENKNVDAVVVVVHGMQEHKERYDEFAKYLENKNIGVILYDLPGHGQSGKIEDRGYFGEPDGWGNLVKSSVDMVNLAKEKFPGKPIVYLGHSMGTMVARTFLQNNDGLIDAMILSGAPCYSGAAGLGKVLASLNGMVLGKKHQSKMLTNLATGSFSSAVKNPKTKLDWLSYNEENVQNYFNDPDCGVPFTAQGYYDLFDGMQRMHNVSAFKVTKPNLPIYFFAGEEDPCIGGEKGFNDSIDTLKKAGYQDISQKLYPHMRHETLNETGRGEVYGDVYNWINEHVAN